MKYLTLILNIGGPKNKQEVEPFLVNFFQDPIIFKFPKFVGRFIGSQRAKKKLIPQYEKINFSPLQEITNNLIENVSNEIKNDSNIKDEYVIKPAFRYGFPTQEQVLDNENLSEYDKVIILSQFPQFSCTTSGSSISNIKQLLQLKKFDLNNVYTIKQWYNNDLYIKSVTELMQKGLQNFQQKPLIVFTSHSLPVNVIQAGDQYVYQITKTIELIMENFKQYNYVQSYQSKVGFLEWIGPNCKNYIKWMHKQGHKDIFLVPIGFVTDHLETLYELDLEYMEELKQEFPELNVQRCESLNVHKTFVECQKDLIVNCEKNHNNNHNRCVNCQNKFCESINI